MSYTYLQERGEVSSAECFSDIPPFVLSKSKSILDEFYCNGNETESCRASQSGMMSQHSTGSPGAEKSMSSVVDSPVRIFPQRVRVQDLMAPEAVYGVRWHESFAKLAPDACSWKTHQCSLLGGWESFSETWPRWGMMQDGVCSERVMSVPSIDEKESGYWPTPNCSTAKFPYSKKTAKRFQIDRRRPSGVKMGFDLNWFPPALEYVMENGHVNPNLQNWLMGWPTNWTNLKPLETDRFRKWLQRHGVFSLHN